MEKSKCTTVFLLVWVSVFVFLSGSKCFGVRCFEQVSQMELDLGEVILYSAWDLDTVDDGYILLIQQSFNADCYHILKVDKQGKLVKTYNKFGFGPGHVSALRNIVVDSDNNVYAAELKSAFVHKFDKDLNFIADYRVKMGGFIYDAGKYFAIRGIYSKDDKNYSLALYTKDNFTFVRYAYEVANPPMLVGRMGGLCRVGSGVLAGVYSNEYQLKLFDLEMKPLKNLVTEVPSHIRKFYPFPGGEAFRHVINNDTMKWASSWTQMMKVFYEKNVFIICYTHDQSGFYDVYSRDGRLLHEYIAVPNGGLYHSDGDYFYSFHSKAVDDDEALHYITKLKLNVQGTGK